MKDSDFEYQAFEVEELGEYEKERLFNKNSFGYGLMIIVLTSVNSGLFILQYYFIKLGLIASCLLFFFTIIFICVYLAFFVRLADRVEKDKDIQIETLDELVDAIFGKYFSWITKIILILFNMVVILVGCLLFSRYFSLKIKEITGISFLHEFWPYEIIYTLLLIIMSLLIVEPEKFKWTNLISFVLVFGSLLVTYCFLGKQINNKPAEIDPYFYDSSYLIVLLPQVIYNVETIGPLFTIRSTLRKRDQMPVIIMSKAVVAVPLFIMNCCLYLYVS